MKRNVLNATQGPIAAGGALVEARSAGEVEEDEGVQELLEGGSFMLDNRENRRRLGLDGAGDGEEE